MPWDKFDVLGIHIYVPPTTLNDQGYSYYDQGLPNLERVVKRHGNKPIWVTRVRLLVAGRRGVVVRRGRAVPGALAGAARRADARLQPVEHRAGDALRLQQPRWLRVGARLVAAEARVHGLSHDGRAAGRRGRVSGVSRTSAPASSPSASCVAASRSRWSGHRTAGTATILSGGDAEVYDLFGARRRPGAAATWCRCRSGRTRSTWSTRRRAWRRARPACLRRAGADASPRRGRRCAGRSWPTGRRTAGWRSTACPISEEFVETLDDGKPYLVQYFERARFEYHPEAADPQYEVLLGQFGRQAPPALPAGRPMPLRALLRGDGAQRRRARSAPTGRRTAGWRSSATRSPRR